MIRGEKYRWKAEAGLGREGNGVKECGVVYYNILEIYYMVLSFNFE